MSFPPGINTAELLRLGNNPDTPGVVLGKDDAFVVDNTTDPATVRFGGLPALAILEQEYQGVMEGPWTVPVPVTISFVRTGDISCMVCRADQFALTDLPDNLAINFLPPIPEPFRPVADAAGVYFIYVSPSFIGSVPYFSSLLAVTAAGNLSLYSFGGGFPVGYDLGVAVGASTGWPCLPLGA